jgi:alpha-1,2-mannosyltransferase
MLAEPQKLGLPAGHSLGRIARWTSVALTLALVGSATLLVVVAASAVFSDESDQVGFDLRAGYLPAAEAIQDGESPYADPDDPTLDVRLPGGWTYVYPPQVAIGVMPLTWLPSDIGVFLVFLASVAALLGTLAIVGVRDVRCYAAVLLWAPTWNALDTLNVSVALALGVALVWRYRSTLWPLAATLGAMVSVKLFLWPLLAWVALNRRPLAAILAFGLGLGITVASWAAIGLVGLRDYPELLSKVGEQENYSVVSVAEEFGLGAVGHALAALAGGGLVVASAWLARREHEIRSFTVAVVACLVLSPVVWLHYLTLLLAPLGLARPRFSPVWLLPIVLWVSPRYGNGEGLEPFVPLVVVLALLTVLVLRPRPVARIEVAS